MRKKIFIDHTIPRKPLPDELKPNWVSDAVVIRRPGFDGTTDERSLHIAG